jgi:NAD(P)-dependent dehydrogenase (short-subunit alcohol dehydrogenase family)
MDNRQNNVADAGRMSTGLRTFDGAVAIVTGAASGIGRALSQALALRGASVVLADIEVSDAEEAAAEVRQKGGRASAKKLDVTRFEDVAELVNATVEDEGRLDYVFNNAGIGVTGEVADYTIESWERILGVNLRGVIHGVQCAYPVMLRQGFGHIVNTASMAGLTTSPGMTSYTTTKHAVVALSRALRAEAAGRGIRASVLCPGVIRTPIIQGGRHGIFLGPVPEERQRALFRELFERLRPMPAPVFARKALDQIARNESIIIIPGWWKVFWWLERVSPAFTSFVARKGFERARRLLLDSGTPGTVERARQAADR